MDLKSKNIVITAGGTGGHIYPALAIAHLLAENGANVIWVGTAAGMEANIVPKDFNMQYIKSSGIRGKSIIKKISFPIKLGISTFKARAILKKFKIDLVLGFGGYVSGPICLAAALMKTPIIIHEQNAKMGLTNRILAKLATKICLAFDIDDLKTYFNNKQLEKIKVVGNPVRKDIMALNNQHSDYSDSKLKILILGGSQGAKAINDIIPELITELDRQGINITVWHQTGQLSFEETKQKYKDIPNQNIKDISPFIFDMAEAYKWADIVICRAGALTVSECAVAGKPAIFIPFPFAVDDHQFFNAQNIVKNNAGFCLRQEQMTLDNLTDIIKPLTLDKGKKLAEMSEIAKKTLIKDSSEQILKCVKEILDKKIRIKK